MNTGDVRDRESALASLIDKDGSLSSKSSVNSEIAGNISGVEIATHQGAGLITLLLGAVKQIISIMAGDKYEGGGIGGSGHNPEGILQESSGSMSAVLQHEVLQGGGIGGSGHAPEVSASEVRHVSQMDQLVIIDAAGGIGGSGHVDGDHESKQVVDPHTDTLIVAVTDAETGGGIGGTGHVSDPSLREQSDNNIVIVEDIPLDAGMMAPIFDVGYNSAPLGGISMGEPASVPIEIILVDNSQNMPANLPTSAVEDAAGPLHLSDLVQSDQEGGAPSELPQVNAYGAGASPDLNHVVPDELEHTQNAVIFA